MLSTSTLALLYLLGIALVITVGAWLVQATTKNQEKEELFPMLPIILVSAAFVIYFCGLLFSLIDREHNRIHEERRENKQYLEWKAANGR